MSIRNKLSIAVFCALALIAAWHYTNLRWSFTGEYQPVSLDLMFEGKADTPAQYRILTVWVVKGLARVFDYHQTLQLFYFVEFFFAAVLVISYRYYLSLYIQNRVCLNVFPFLIFYCMAFNYIYPYEFIIDFPYVLPSSMHLEHFKYNIYYPYDTPSIFFFVLAMIGLNKKHWPLFYATFVIATFNRETTCFFTIIYIITAYGNESIGNIVKHCVAQFIIWCSIKVLLYYCFISNDGIGLLKMSLSNNIEVLLSFKGLLFHLSSMGFIMIPSILYYRRINEMFVRRSFLIIIPYYLTMFFVGGFWELRDFGELIPTTLTAFTVLVSREDKL